MKNSLTENLIYIIKKSIPDNEYVVNALMDILCIGKESAYRRMRGDVPFTFDEAAKVAAKLGFSLDSVVGINDDKKALFSLNFLKPGDLIDNYCRQLEYYIDIFRRMNRAKESIARLAVNTLPYSLYLPFAHLSKFRLYRYIYQANGVSSNHSDFSQVEIPSYVYDIQNAFVKEYVAIKKAIFILDRNVFQSIVYDINYFSRLNLISKEDVDVLKDELFLLLANLENLTLSGKHEEGTDVQVYLANVDLGTSYAHHEFDGIGYSNLRVYSIDAIDSQNASVCLRQKQWIESLRRCSTLITQSGEMQRFEYFKTQRAIVSLLV